MHDALLLREREVTRGRVVAVRRKQLRDLRTAYIHHVRASGVERATAGYVDQGGGLPLDRAEPLGPGLVDPADRLHEAPRVGVMCAVVDVPALAVLCNLPRV